jgi:hypothetical protein
MIILPTSDSAGLVQTIREAIDRRRVRTWTYDEEGDFTHTAAQWAGQAWLRPILDPDALRLSIVPPAETHLSTVIYGIYHGRFIEMVLNHFDGTLTGHARASAFPEREDQVQ